MPDEIEYIPITIEDAVEAVLNSAWAYGADIPDLGALIQGVQNECESRGSEPGDLELRCVGCRIEACHCAHLRIALGVNVANFWLDGELGPVMKPRTVFVGSAVFSRSVFEQDVYFNGADFLCGADFSLATFAENSSFERAKFAQRVDFMSASFKQGVDFQRIVFTGDADFRGAEFTKDTKFFAAAFEQSAVFGGAAFAGNAELTGVRFVYPVDFRGVRFTQRANFQGATFAQCGDFTRAEISSRLILKGAVLGSKGLLDFTAIDLRPGGHIQLTIEQIGRWGRKLIAGEDSKDKAKLASAAAQYNMLRDNFRTLPSTDPEEDRCHYKYMDLRRRASDWHWAHRFADWFLFKWCYGYGVYTHRVLVTVALVIVICGAIHAVGATVWETDVIKGYDDHFNPWYFSVITFTTIGYGDYAPRGWLRWVAGAEGFLGLFLMAVFTVSFARKFIR